MLLAEPPLQSKTGLHLHRERRTMWIHGESIDEHGRSLTADRRTKAKTVAKKGHGDQGDQKKAAVKKK